MPIRWNRPNKYGNIHTSRGDSILETRRRAELELLQRAGKIKDLKRQVKYVLIPAQYEYYHRYGKNGNRLKDGKKLLEKECSYYADFVYTDCETGETVVEDAKGFHTDKYLIKRKLMLYLHDIRIKEYTKDG